MSHVVTGLERLINDATWQKAIKGNIGLLCHSASITRDYQIAPIPLKKIFGPRLKKLFGPQHGFVTDVQDNMIESKDYIHPYFKIPVHSLYSHTRIPTDEMLQGLDTILVDLQDVGTRVYTYIHTLTLLMEKCAQKGIEVVILDRPNPVGGILIEGNVLKHGYESFVGRRPIPQRHGLTMGEIALMEQKYFTGKCELKVVPMLHWQRSQYFLETGIPFVNPSPNLSSSEGTIVYVGTVLFEGTNISEGRGTTRALEVVGHPKIEPYGLHEKIAKELEEWQLDPETGGVILRPVVFNPTFHKFQNMPCGGFHVHVTNPHRFLSWRMGQFLCQLFYRELGSEFKWSEKPYEYEFNRLAIDFINGDESIRHWVEKDRSLGELMRLEQHNLSGFLSHRSNVLLYS